MSAFPYTRRNGATTYVDAQSTGVNISGSSDFRAVIPDSSLPTADVGLLSTIFPEGMNITGVTILGSTTIGPNGDEINSFYFYKARYYFIHSRHVLVCCLKFYVHTSYWISIINYDNWTRIQKLKSSILYVYTCALELETEKNANIEV